MVQGKRVAVLASDCTRGYQLLRASCIQKVLLEHLKGDSSFPVPGVEKRTCRPFYFPSERFLMLANHLPCVTGIYERLPEDAEALGFEARWCKVTTNCLLQTFKDLQIHIRRAHGVKDLVAKLATFSLLFFYNGSSSRINVRYFAGVQGLRAKGPVALGGRDLSAFTARNIRLSFPSNLLKVLH
jgi:hypothetical protein